MPVYTVHEPPPRKNETATDAARFVFVHEGFHLWAFLLAPLWLLWRRLWLVLLLYVVAMTALQGGLILIGTSRTVQFTVGVLISLLIGFEAAMLQRWTFARRNWTNLGVVVGSDIEAAERRFFDSWVARNAPSAPPAGALPGGPPPTMRTPPASPDVIGLFPEPQSRR